MRWMLLALTIGCDASRTDAPNKAPSTKTAQQPIQGQAPIEARPVASKSTAVEPPHETRCPDGSDPQPTAVPIGPHTLTTLHCSVDGETRMVAAHVEGTSWQYTPSNDETEHAFEWIGTGAQDHGYMVLRRWACPMDGCERATFFQWGTNGSISQLGEPTTAHEWSIHQEGQLQYKAKEGFEAGYSVASATQTFVWDGATFTPRGSPTAGIEHSQWPCADTTVPVVNPTTGAPTGDTVSVRQGSSIEVLRIGPNQPLGSLFEYRVDGVTFWASSWAQDCAG